jgi:hypothetical protein
MADTDTLETVEPPKEGKLRGRTSLLTTLLVVFNLLAVLGFAVLLYIDLGKRQAWAKAVFLRDLAIVGLPIDDKDSKFSSNPEAGTQPKHDLDPPSIKDAYKARGGKASDRFMAAQENFKVDIRPADLDQDILAKYFSDAGAGTPVGTLQEEVRRLKDKLPGEIDAVAQTAVSKAKDKTPEDKQALLRKILLPLCGEGWQVDDLEKKIQETREGKKDDEFLAAAVKRRLWFEVLKPLEVFRPSEKVNPEKLAADEQGGEQPKQAKSPVDRAARLDEVSIEDLKKHFVKRCDDGLAAKDWIDKNINRDNVEKRRYIAFLLTAVSQLEVPGAERAEQPQPAAKPGKKAPAAKKKDAEGKADEDQKLDEPPAQKAEAQRPQRQLAFPNAEKRAEAVCGLHAFDQACEDLAIVTEILLNNTVQAIHRDLGTYRYPVDPQHNANALGFLAKYDMALQRVQELAKLVERRERQYAELLSTHEEHAKLLESRTAQEKDTLVQLYEARAQTRQLARDLKALQDQLFIAQVNLRGAHEYNQYLVERLQAAEKKTSKSKGGQ